VNEILVPSSSRYLHIAQDSQEDVDQLKFK